MSPLWQKVYDANYHKSLDHRSFYFKQTDKRLLGAKGMIGDIRGACPCHLLIVPGQRRDDHDALTLSGRTRSRYLSGKQNTGRSQTSRTSDQPPTHPAAEIVERRRQADGGLAAVSAAADFSARLHADLTYTFPARNVHEVPLA